MLDDVPAAQSEQAVEATAEYAPTGHETQKPLLEAPNVVEYVPAGQF